MIFGVHQRLPRRHRDGLPDGDHPLTAVLNGRRSEADMTGRGMRHEGLVGTVAAWEGAGHNPSHYFICGAPPHFSSVHTCNGAACRRPAAAIRSAAEPQEDGSRRQCPPRSGTWKRWIKRGSIDEEIPSVSCTNPHAPSPYSHLLPIPGQIKRADRLNLIQSPVACMIKQHGVHGLSSQCAEIRAPPSLSFRPAPHLNQCRNPALVRTKCPAVHRAIGLSRYCMSP